MNNNRKNNGFSHNVLFYSVIFLCIMGIAYFLFGGNSTTSQSKNLSQSEFISALKSDKVKSFQLQPDGGVYRITGTYRKAQPVSSSSTTGFSLGGQSASSTTNFESSVLESDVTIAQLQKYAEKEKVEVSTKSEESNSLWMNLLVTVLPLVIMIFFFYMMMGQAGQGGGGRGVMNFGKTKTKPSDPKENKVRFSDVAGEEEEKQELVEIVEFLKNPKKFMRLGARIPAGVEPGRRSWLRPWPEKPVFRSSPSPVRTSLKCSLGLGPAGSGTCSNKLKRPHRRSSSLMKSTPLVAAGGTAWVVVTTNVSKP